MKLKGLGKMLVMAARWKFDRKWHESTKRRVLKAKADAEFVSKPFRMTALRRFVLDRSEGAAPVECTCCDTGVQDPQCGYPHKR